MYRLTRLSLAYPRFTLLLLAVITVVLGAGLPQVRPEYGYRVLVGDDHPTIRALDEMIATFGGGLPATIAWECGEGLACGSVFDEASLSMADAVTRGLEKSPAVMEVIGPSNAPLLVPTEGGFNSRRFIERGERATDADELAVRALDDPLWAGHLVSEDGRAGAILVQSIDSRSETDLSLVEAIEATIAPHESNGFKFYLVGYGILGVISSRDLATSSARLIPFTVLVIGLIVFVLSRSFSQTAIALTTMGVGLLWTVGLMGWLGWPQDSIHEVLAPLILVVGVCDAIHILSRYAAECQKRGGASTRAERGALLEYVARNVGLGCLVTTLTTTGAFLSFTSSAIDTFVRFGAIAAFGVTVCLILTFTLLPVLTQFFPVGAAGSERATGIWETALGAVVRICSRRTGPILLSSLLLFVICVFGWVRYLQVGTDWIESWGEESFVVESIQFLEDRMAPSMSLELQLELPDSTPVESPEALGSVKALSVALSSIDGLGKTESVLDLLGHLNRLIHDDSPAFDRVGASASANAELLELISFDSPRILNSWVSFDRSKIRVSTKASRVPYSREIEILESVEVAINEHLPSDWNVVTSGDLAVDRDWLRDVQGTQVRSFPIAFAIVFFLVAMFLRSWRLALAAMIPTTLPVVVTLGAMGWLGLSLDVGRAMIAAVLLGIAVDDSVHILRHYQVARRRGAGSHDAIREAVLHTGRAVATTSLALALGFLTLMASSWQSIASFGFFIAVAILAALVATLFILPALIFAFTSGDTESTTSGPSHDSSQPVSDVARRLSSLLILLPVGASLVGAGHLAARDDNPREFPCWVLQGQVIPLPGTSCPLHFLDQIHSVGEIGSVTAHKGPDSVYAAIRDGPDASNLVVTVARSGELESVRVPLSETTTLARTARWASAALLVCGLLGIPLFLLWRSSAAAAGPLGFFYTAVAVVCVTGIAGRGSEWMNTGALVAFLVAPAALAHLSFVFPLRGRLIERAPRLALLPYLGSVLAGIAGFAVLRNPILLPALGYLMLALSIAACALLLASCYFASRESESPLERSQARVVFMGALMLPVLPALLALGHSGMAASTATYLCMFSLGMPVPLGLAISRYNLFDLGWDVRRGLSQLLYSGIAGAVSAVVLYSLLSLGGASRGMQDLWMIFGAASGVLLAGELIRAPVLRSLHSLLIPQREVLRRARAHYTKQVNQLRDGDEVADLVAGVLRDGLGSRSGCVFLCRWGQWRPAAMFGREPPALLSLVEMAEAVLGDQVLVHLRQEFDDRPPVWRLLESEGVEVVVSLGSGGSRFGIVLLGSRNRNSRDLAPYAGAELDFVGLTCAQAGIALHNAEIAERGATAGRQQATGRMAVTLIHDVGKDLGWMRMLQNRMAKRNSDPGEAARYNQLRELTESVQARVKAFLRDATQPRNDPPGVVSIDDLLSRVVLRVAARRPGVRQDRVHLSVDPAMRQVGCYETLGEVVANLIENALQASSPDQSITVAVVEPETLGTESEGTPQSQGIEIFVKDRGCGIAPNEHERVFELGYTTETDRGGSGVGLAVSRDIVESLNGRLTLESRAGGGTRATIRVPAVGVGV